MGMEATQGNQIRVVAFNVPQSTHGKMFFDICNAEIARKNHSLIIFIFHVKKLN